MSYKRILVPVDGSDTADAGLRQAIALARAQGARLRLVNIVDLSAVLAIPEAGFTIDTVIEDLERNGREVLADATKRAAKAGVKCDTALVEGAGRRVADHIADQAKRWKADAIVMGTHGRRGLSRVLMGSDAELVLRESTSPVMLVHAAKGKNAGAVFKRIMVPLDGSTTSRSGLAEAITIARGQNARLHLVHVVDRSVVANIHNSGIARDAVIGNLDEFGQAVLEQGVKAAKAKGVTCDTAMIPSSGSRVADKITAEAARWRADLLVIGTHGRSGIKRAIMGSDAELVVRGCTVPVLLVHGPRGKARKR